MIKVYIKKIENFDPNETEIIKNTLSTEAHERLNRKRNEELHHASLCAISLLSVEERSDLAYTENGRPHFKTLDKDISISHSKTYTAVAISNSKSTPVGIDIEDISADSVGEPLRHPLNVPLTRFFTQNEQKHLLTSTSCPHLTRGVPAKQTEGEILTIWTKKEALFKFLKSDSTPFIRLDSTDPEQYGASFMTLQIENSTLTICTPPEKQIEIIQK